MNPFNDIEQINFNPFNFFTDQDQQDMRDSELNYFNDLNSNNFDSLFVFEENVKRNICHIKKYDNLSFIHVHIRSMNSDFVIFFYIVRILLTVCKIWITDNNIKNNTNFHLPNFGFTHQERKTGKKGGGILIYVKNHIKFRMIKDFSVSDGDSERCYSSDLLSFYIS